MNEIEARKARAVAMLSAWLQAEDPILDLLTEIREAVEHVIDCDGKDHSCAGTTDECEYDEKCEHCPPGDCEDCVAYRTTGSGPRYWATRPTLELLDELTLRLERREEMAS